MNLIRSLAEDRKGNVGMLFALLAIPVFAVTGLAVDYGKAVSVKHKLQQAADTAALAAVRLKDATEEQREAQGTAVFAANVSGDPVLAAVVPSVVVTGTDVVVQASTSVVSPFGSLVGIPSVTVDAESKASQAVSGGRQIELAIMVDLTGSMGATRGSMTKIEALKQAGNDLLDIMLPNSGANSGNVKIAIAPFADYVNAGEYAADVTGLASMGGAYANVSNLASTQNGNFTGSYTGVTGSSAGSQAGATAAATTYDNGYCANPTQTAVSSVVQTSGYDTGIWLPNYWYNSTQYTGAALPGTMRASSSAPVVEVSSYSSSALSYYSGTWSSDYYVPLLTSNAGLTQQTRTAEAYTYYYGSYYSIGTKTGPVGAAVSGSGTPSAPFVSAGSGYWRLYGIHYSGTPLYTWTTSGYYVPVYESLSAATTVAGCEASVVQKPSSKLITCVTERGGSEAYTDAAPSTSSVGAYNHGNSSKSNYSSDGKCWVAGREMPSIIPLTHNKSQLSQFFDNATIGGATPGHLGTAWAWYMLSPNWSNVFTGDSAPAPYNTPNKSKVAVLMTDGEYNIHYTSPTARTQALALCANMKAQGITVYTVGFGFSSNSAAGDGSAEGNAKDLLTQCSSGSNHYYFPYDGDALRRVFQDIGNGLSADLQVVVSKVTN